MPLQPAQFEGYVGDWRPSLGVNHPAFAAAHRMFGSAAEGGAASASMPLTHARTRMTVEHPVHGEKMTMPVVPYDDERVAETLRGVVRGTVHPEMTDPRLLMATQSSVTGRGMKYYMHPDNEYERHGATFADQGNVGNRHPVVYQNDEIGARFVLSGHHRATAAILKGRPLHAIVVRGGSGKWGPMVGRQWHEAWAGRAR